MRVRYQMRLGEEQTMRMGNPLAGRGSHAGSLSRSLPGHPKSVQNLFWSARYYGRDSDTTPEVTVLVSRAQVTREENAAANGAHLCDIAGGHWDWYSHTQCMNQDMCVPHTRLRRTAIQWQRG